MNKNDCSQDKSATIGINNDLNAKMSHYNNIDQNIIIITEDKTEIILRDYLKKIELKSSWITALGIFISLLAIPVTTESFKPLFLIPAESVKTMVYLGIIISFFYLTVSLWRTYQNRHISIKGIIKLMKKTED